MPHLNVLQGCKKCPFLFHNLEPPDQYFSSTAECGPFLEVEHGDLISHSTIVSLSFGALSSSLRSSPLLSFLFSGICPSFLPLLPNCFLCPEQPYCSVLCPELTDTNPPASNSTPFSNCPYGRGLFPSIVMCTDG